MVRIGLPCARVFAQGLRLIVGRIERYGHEDQILAQTILVTLLERTEIVGQAKTVIGERTACVHKVQGDHFPLEIVQPYLPPPLIGEREVGNRLARVNSWWARPECLIKRLQPPRIRGLAVRTGIAHDTDILSE